MKLFIGLVSYNRKIRETFVEKKTALFSKETATLLRDHNIETQFGYFNTDKPNNNVDEYFLASTIGADYVLAIVETDAENLLASIRHALFCAVIPNAHDQLNLANYLRPIFQRLIKNFLRLLARMSAGESEQAMILPFRNFNAPEIIELAQVCKNRNMINTFENELRIITSAIHERRKPRRNSSYATKYFIDDAQTHFVYGPETHSSIGTGEPHRPYCELNGTFRFGKRIPTNRHFNMSKGRGDDTEISGDFPNCHGEEISVPKQTHINMFANDHH